eukprot:1242275-Rhodomonas_salina.3
MRSLGKGWSFLTGERCHVLFDDSSAEGTEHSAAKQADAIEKGEGGNGGAPFAGLIAAVRATGASRHDGQ